ncbi:MAG: HvfC/BufC family peptide modification chaperone, partial [Methylocella sp.]
ELQLRFQAGIVKGDNAILASIVDSRRTNRATLFAVYHDAYRLRLAEFLANDFPILRVHLGEEAFGRLVEDYILSAPSRQPNARWYGTRLPEFMQKTAPWRSNRSAVDLARFERALSDAFDAPDAPVSTLDALRDISAEDWPRLAFEFQPSVRLLDLERGTAQIYAALAEQEEAPAIQQGEEAIVFWRNDGQSFYRPVAEDERLALLEAGRGKSFEDICALLAFQGNGAGVTQRVAGLLSQWFADGLVTRLSISD